MEIMLKKWGDDLAIAIPNAIARHLSLKDGSIVDINGSTGEIIIKPRQRYNLPEMLDKIDEQNIHAEIETGAPVGKEAW